MDGEPDVDLLALRPALTGLARALDSLRERLDRLERDRSRPATSRVDTGAVADAGALQIVQEILASPSASLRPDELFTLAMERASGRLDADRSMLLVPEAQRLVPRAARGFRREDLNAVGVRPGEGMIGRAFELGQVVTYSAGAVGDADGFVERFPVHEAIAVPVRGEEGTTGVVYVGRRRPVPFSAGEVLLVLVVADRVGAGLVSETHARHTARLGELEGAAASLLATRPLPDSLSEACAAGCRLVGVRAAAVALEMSLDEMEIVASHGLRAGAGHRVRAREGVTADLHETGDVVACRDLQARPVTDRSFLGEAGVRACLLVPMVARGARLGVLYLADTEARDFSPDEIAAARVLAAMMASGVLNGRWGADLARAPSAVERAGQIDKVRTLSQMATGLARELNNVFATILGKSRLLLTRAHDEPLRDGLGLLEEAAWRGADLVHRLVGLATPAGATDASVDMVALVRDVLGARPRGQDAGAGRGDGVDVVTTLQSVPAVRGRETALREALASLVANAVDAMEAGGQLSVATRPLDGGVEIVLEDTGEGMAEAIRSHVFDPFFTTRSPQHMGLGLTVAQGVIVQHGGRIEIANTPTQGARVSVWLPGAPAGSVPASLPRERGPLVGEPSAPAAVPADTPAVTDPAMPSPPPLSPAREVPSPAPDDARSDGPRPATPPTIEIASILVLEDEGAVRSLLVEALTQAGHRVETAVDGIAGLAKLDGHAFDVVVADLALPQRSGLAIARSVKRIHPRTPVVLITGWGHLLDQARLHEHGVDLVLVKPFRIERVLSVVSDALRLRASA